MAETKYYQSLERARKELRELEIKAEIKDKPDSKGYPPDHGRHDLREVYFSVQDTALRRQLIEKYAHIESLIVGEAEQDWKKAIKNRDAAKKTCQDLWCIKASIVAGILICAGYQISMMWALIGLASGTFAGLTIKEDAARNFQYAEVSLIEAHKNFQEVVREFDTFSKEEVRTGEPN